MAATVESLIAAGIDADTARNIAPFVAPDHGQKFAATKAKAEAMELRSAIDLFGAGSSLTVAHYRVYGQVATSYKAPGLKQLGGKAVQSLVTDLLAAGHLVTLAGGKYEHVARA